jgi:general L-amino acid transport system permease protein
MENLAARGMQTGFDFLFHTAGFGIDFTLIPYDPGTSSYLRVFLVGIVNTLFLSFLAIITSTILAFIVGISRLSSNWLVAKLASAYVELIRNTPLLVQIVFWHASIFFALPQVKQSIDVFDLGIFFINNRGFYVPTPVTSDFFLLCLIGLVIAIAAIIGLRFWARRHQARSGNSFPVLWTSLVIIPLLIFLIPLIAGVSLDWSLPVLGQYNYEGGARLPTAFVIVLIGLTIYHSAHKAETIRAGIQSVRQGQLDAARALGLRRSQMMALVLIPQAMRAIIPSMINGWLTVTRNASLGIAIGYPELVGLFMQTSLNQFGHAIEIVAMVMGFYVVLSLAISGLLNLYNKRVAVDD